jgi:hypothetical protein
VGPLAARILASVNFASVAHGQKIKDAFWPVEIIDDAVIADSYTKGIHAFHSVVGVGVQLEAQAIDRRL